MPAMSLIRIGNGKLHLSLWRKKIPLYIVENSSWTRFCCPHAVGRWYRPKSVFTRHQMMISYMNLNVRYLSLSRSQYQSGGKFGRFFNKLIGKESKEPVATTQQEGPKSNSDIPEPLEKFKEKGSKEPFEAAQYNTLKENSNIPETLNELVGKESKEHVTSLHDNVTKDTLNIPIGDEKLEPVKEDLDIDIENKPIDLVSSSQLGIIKDNPDAAIGNESKESAKASEHDVIKVNSNIPERLDKSIENVSREPTVATHDAVQNNSNILDHPESMKTQQNDSLNTKINTSTAPSNAHAVSNLNNSSIGSFSDQFDRQPPSISDGVQVSDHSFNERTSSDRDEMAHTVSVDKSYPSSEDNQQFTEENLQVGKNLKAISKTDVRRNLVNYRYLYACKGTTQAHCTPQYDNTKTLLKSLGVTRTDELAYYPDIQVMDHSDIIRCVDRLKQEGFLLVFSLYLIQKTFEYLDSKATDVFEEPYLSYKPPKLTKSYRLSELAPTRIYFKLCHLLERPDLDPYWLLEQCENQGIYDTLHSLCKKVELFKNEGLTVDEILSNLKIFYAAFEKMKYYKHLVPDHQGKLPIDLFLNRTPKSFIMKLGMTKACIETSRMLGLNYLDYMVARGRVGKTPDQSLPFKVRLCLGAGYSKKDIITNISDIDKFPLEKLYNVLAEIKGTGLPVSAFLLRESAQAFELKEENKSQATDEHLDMNGDESLTSGEEIISADKQPIKPSASTSLRKGSSYSTKKKSLYRMIAYTLKLNRAQVQALSLCKANLDNVSATDIMPNLKFLLSQDFTEEHLQNFPIILANPHNDLKETFRNYKWLYCTNLNVPSSIDTARQAVIDKKARVKLMQDLLESFDTVNVDGFTFSLTHEDITLYNSLIADPVKCLSAVQYFLDKEQNFYHDHVNEKEESLKH